MFVSIQANANEYKKEFVFISKSFSRDLERSVVMYKSIEKFQLEKIDTYIIVPTKELNIFISRFQKDKKSASIEQMPHFLSEESVLEKCGILNKTAWMYKNPKRWGWHIQQMVKMCFAKTKIAKDYVSLDADVYFTKHFDKSIFYTSDKKLKTVAHDYGFEKSARKKFHKLQRSDREFAYSYYKFGFIRYIYDTPDLTWYDFVSNYGIWSSDILDKLETYIKKTKNYDFYDAIIAVPCEMQWYGIFIQTKYPELLYTQKPIFMEVADIEDSDSLSHCKPTNGYRDNYGVAHQPHVSGRKSIIYKMPDTLFCSLKHKLRNIVKRSNPF